MHTMNIDLHTMNIDLHTMNIDLHTMNIDLHTMNIDLHKVLSSVPCVNIVLYQKMQKWAKSNLNICK